MKKFDYDAWKAKMISSNDESYRSPVLQLRFSRNSTLEGGNGYIPFFVHDVPFGKNLRGISFKENQQTVTNAKRLEAVIMRVFQKTNYENFKDKDVIEMGRYLVEPSKLPYPLLNRLFNHIFTDENKRNSKSWLLPIQNKLIEYQIGRYRADNIEDTKIKKSRRRGQSIPEDFEAAVPDPFDAPTVREFRDRLEAQALPSEPRIAIRKPKPHARILSDVEISKRQMKRSNTQKESFTWNIPTPSYSARTLQVAEEMFRQARSGSGVISQINGTKATAPTPPPTVTTNTTINQWLDMDDTELNLADLNLDDDD